MKNFFGGALIGAVVLFLVLWMNDCTGLNEDFREEYQAFRDTIQVVRGELKVTQEVVDSLNKENDALKIRGELHLREIYRLERTGPTTQRLREERQRVDSLLQTKTDSVEMARTIIPELNLLNTSLFERVNNLELQKINFLAKQRVDSLRIDNFILQVDTLTASLKRVNAVLADTPVLPPSNAMLFWKIPLPSRKTVAVSSAVLGFIGGLYIGEKYARKE